jgi:hypothetical protein
MCAIGAIHPPPIEVGGLLALFDKNNLFDACSYMLDDIIRILLLKHLWSYGTTLY